MISQRKPNLKNKSCICKKALYNTYFTTLGLEVDDNPSGPMNIELDYVISRIYSIISFNRSESFMSKVKLAHASTTRIGYNIPFLYLSYLTTYNHLQQQILQIGVLSLLNQYLHVLTKA